MYKESTIRYLGYPARPMASGPNGDSCFTRTQVAQWVREVKASGNIPRVLRSGRSWFTRSPDDRWAWLDWGEE